MAVDMFLKLGDIDGESRDDAHRDWIDVLAWSWGASIDAGSAAAGRRGGGASRPMVQDMSLTKWIDSASADELVALLSAERIASAELEVRRAGASAGKGTGTYLRISLTDVLVTSVSTGGSGGEDRLTENISLNFGGVTFSYTEQDDTGADRPVDTVTYDVARDAVTDETVG